MKKWSLTGALAALAMLLGACGTPAKNAEAKATTEPAAADAAPEKSAAAEAPPAPASAVPDYTPGREAGMLRLNNKAYLLQAAKWDRNAIGVCWEAGAPRGPERDWVKAAITRTWQAHSRLSFFGWSDCANNARGIRIAIRDLSANDGPHVVKLGKLGDGLASGMVLNFTFRTWSQDCAVNEVERKSCIESIAVHEFGHAIGLAHEHNRHDKPGDCRRAVQGTNGDLLLTPYDPQSVMNYCNKRYNNDGQLSQGDKDGLAVAYPR